MNRKLVAFDVDGVLLRGKLGGFKDILVILGKSKEVHAIDEEYQRRKYTGPWGMEQLTKLYKGFSESELREISNNYCQKNRTEGAKKYIAELRSKGYIAGALSSNPQFIMDSLAEDMGLDFSEGTRLEFKKGIATGKIQKKVDRYIKAEILQEKICSYGLKKKDVIAVGDSITDLSMAEMAGTFIAFQPKDDMLKEKADIVIESFQQLRKVLL